jgi:ABC-type bacteriocin/lantibiotic exporter with double-glycine peptidase domain
VYGAYFRKLSKKVQAELAEANAVAQEVMGNITTVKSHAAAQSAQAAYAAKLGDYYALQLKESAAYSAYAAATTFLPSTVAAAVLFYGGHLVLAGQVRG